MMRQPMLIYNEIFERAHLKVSGTPNNIEEVMFSTYFHNYPIQPYGDFPGYYAAWNLVTNADYTQFEEMSWGKLDGQKFFSKYSKENGLTPVGDIMPNINRPDINNIFGLIRQRYPRYAKEVISYMQRMPDSYN